MHLSDACSSGLPMDQPGCAMAQTQKPAPAIQCPTSLTADRSSAATAAATALLQSAASTRSKVPKGRAIEAGA